MRIPKEERIPAHPPVAKGVFTQGPQRVILMTPLMCTVGALLVFFAVAVIVVVILPTFTMSPPPSDNWAPYTDQALRGRATYLANGCLYCHSGFSRPQDVFNANNYLYTRASEPGDYWDGDPSPNVLGTARTGPDLSQEGGHHPDGWHDAHYFSPRATTPLSIMPRFIFLTDEERAGLIAFNQEQGGKEAMLRNAAVEVGNKLMRVNMGMMPPDKAFPALAQSLQSSGALNVNGKPDDKSPSGIPWMGVWHMNSFERSYWLTQDPLELNQQNLMRGKTIYIQRCAGCHGETGNGKGSAAQFLMPTPFDFTSDEMDGTGASPGQLYHRILTAGPGTAMENFGQRLTVEDIWRVVIFLRTIKNGSLEQSLVTPEMYTEWTPPPPMIQYISEHPIPDAAAVRKPKTEPFMSAAIWVAPGMAPGDEILVGGVLPMTLDRLAGLIEDTYTKKLEQAYNEAMARGDPLPGREQVFSLKGVEFHYP